MFPCIYCRRLDVARTEEHVLQAAFGATAILASDVCGDCNNAFSGIDKYFVDSVNRWHLGKWSTASLGIGTLREFSTGAMAARIQSDGLATVFPQLVLGESEQWTFHGISEQLLPVMLKELELSASPTIRSRLADSTQTFRIRIIRSAPGTFLVSIVIIRPSSSEQLCDDCVTQGTITPGLGSSHAGLHPYPRASASKSLIISIGYEAGAQDS